MDLIDDNKFEADKQRSREYFNHIIGIITFTISLACLSFDNPQKVALLCLPVVFSLLAGAPNFRSLKEARDLIDYAESDEDKEILKQRFNEQINKKSRVKQVFEVFIYFYGVLFYSLVLMRPDVTSYLKSVGWAW
ncbi:hypothetical protein J4H19_22800 [Vibrio alginolyticus]|uniref:hypothetical protein n=1 Tax=Vibrio alginolyticus TaxID=663 RepID=UPI001BD5B632|nr:hypothetical protein [Vibrio alginolyticus]MBS9839414.1 hypothetical protein [Vibrio alginolyticus]